MAYTNGHRGAYEVARLAEKFKPSLALGIQAPQQERLKTQGVGEGVEIVSPFVLERRNLRAMMREIGVAMESGALAQTPIDVPSVPPAGGNPDNAPGVGGVQ